jgi:aspartate racemase
MRNTAVAMRRIGILGGASDQATIDYYRRFNKILNDRFGGWNTAELIISSMNFAFSRDCALDGRWDDLGAYLSDRAVALELAGAELLVCVSNTLHRLADMFTSGISIPFLHIVDPTARVILDLGLKRVALLGTKTVMATNHLKDRYTNRFGIEIIVPEPDEQDLVDRVIFEELCRGRFTSTSKAAYLSIVDKLQASGAEGVILGCTEIPLLIAQRDRPEVPFFDTAGLHVAAALGLAIGERLKDPTVDHRLSQAGDECAAASSRSSHR